MSRLDDIDTTTAPELSEGFEPFPPGDYTLYLESDEWKATKAGDGEYLNCVFTVAEGQYKDRKIFQMFNLRNKSPKAVDIAKAQWRTLCEATVGQPNAPGNDTSNIQFKPFIAAIRVVAAEGNFPAKNEIVFRPGKIRPASSAPRVVAAVVTQPVAQSVEPVAAAQTVTQAPAAQAPAVATGSRPAWAKR